MALLGPPFGTPFLIPEVRPKKFMWSLFCVLSQEMRHINFFLAQNWGFWVGRQKVYVEKAYVLLPSPTEASDSICNFGPEGPKWPLYPVLLFLGVFVSLVFFFLGISLVFLSVFCCFTEFLRFRTVRKILGSFWSFPWCFWKDQGKEGQGSGQKFSQTYTKKIPEGPKIKKIRDFDRDWKFRSRMKFSSEPPTAALFLWGNRDIEIKIFERDQKFRSGLKISIEIKFFWSLGPLGLVGLLISGTITYFILATCPWSDLFPKHVILSVLSMAQKNFSGLQKGPAERGHVKNRQKVSKSFSTLFNNFSAGQKTSKIVEKCQKVFRHFSTIFAQHHFSGPFWGALRITDLALRGIWFRKCPQNEQ